jgi:hypothetical protein
MNVIDAHLLQSRPCSLGKEDSEGKCLYLNPISDGKYECNLITDSVYPMQKFIDIIWLGRGCALKTYEKEIFEYYKETYK